ncbi:Hypothetical Protein FCC1311_061842 [Hondaea fermentalgiana]|uniref:Uncharacterized protein n=1 Tax=Hondaea fermentalgiana TaxID=2315210 RepID=A0A2R5GPZ8_9STRA|nr:Hypothetical Protein FCC1311_061842 [Hondaea fermentalgiana]|eukprot:GBG29964.1 Hypothetical Protein FCC1311_061842 [Hondaea fermentalgiana]
MLKVPEVLRRVGCLRAPWAVDMYVPDEMHDMLAVQGTDVSSSKPMAHERRVLGPWHKVTLAPDKLDAGFDTDVDCGGECRDVTVLDRGLWFPRRCGFAQQCEIGADCLSGSCVSGRCAARAPFAAVPETELIRNMHYAYFHLAEQKNEDTLDAQDVDEFFKLVFNPDQVDLTETQTALLDQGLVQFKDSQGLQDSGSSVALQYGFLARGRSLQFAKEMIQSANAASRRREL